MPSTIGMCKLLRINRTTVLEGETFLRNKHKITFFKIKRTIRRPIVDVFFVLKHFMSFLARIQLKFVNPETTINSTQI